MPPREKRIPPISVHDEQQKAAKKLIVKYKNVQVNWDQDETNTYMNSILKIIIIKKIKRHLLVIKLEDERGEEESEREIKLVYLYWRDREGNTKI